MLLIFIDEMPFGSCTAQGATVHVVPGIPETREEKLDGTVSVRAGATSLKTL